MYFAIRFNKRIIQESILKPVIIKIEDIPILKNAIKRLENGQAKATSNSSRSGFSKYLGLIITGLAQPIFTINNIMSPIGSIWAIGLSVSLPWILGVGSPNLVATRAWANSCIDSDKSKITIRIKDMISIVINTWIS